MGASGSGKSTLFALLQRLYGPENGHITLDGRPLSSYSAAHLRTYFSVVAQAPVLFAGTVAENIAYGTTGIPHADVRRAAVAAGIHAFVAGLPEGYATRLESGGRGLSDGQRQRIAIARALVRRPCVLLLDEPTSWLDDESAETVRETVRWLIAEEGVTVVLATHCKKTAAVAGRLVRLEAGRLVSEDIIRDSQLEGY